MRVRGLIWFCMMVALAQAAWAIDNDSDSMSDVWQSLYGIGAEQAGDDPDDDGDSNLHEAWAGTDPGDPNSNSRLNNSRNGDQVTLTWSGVTKMPYIVQTSTNLISWSHGWQRSRQHGRQRKPRPQPSGDRPTVLPPADPIVAGLRLATSCATGRNS